MNKLIIIINLLILASCEQGADVVESRFFKKSNGASSSGSSRSVKWPDSKINSKLEIKIADAFTNTYTAEDLDERSYNPIDQMIASWDESLSQNIFNLPASITTNKNHAHPNDYYDSEMGIYKSTNWFSSVDSNALAITQYYGITRNAGTASEYLELVHADIIVNFRDFNYSYDRDDYNTYDLPSVILHELGHFVGIQHNYNTNEDSVMMPYFSIYDSYRNISAIDADKMVNLYGTSSYSALTTKGLSSSNFKRKEKQYNPDELERHVIELKADNVCVHKKYIGKKLKEHSSHSVDSNKFKKAHP